jgi:hypothetical protein
MEILGNARKEYIFTATISTMTSREHGTCISE